MSSLPGATAGSSDTAKYTLIGAIVTAAITVIGLIVKHYWDVAAENRTASRADSASAEARAHEIRKLMLELTEARSESRRKTNRETYARFLSATHSIYAQVLEARRARQTGSEDKEYLSLLKAIQPLECQVTLEELRVTASTAIVSGADQIWSHLRGHDVATGRELSNAAWHQWRKDYWVLRKLLVAKIRDEFDEQSL
jgi:hypothetical protein